MIVSIWVNDLTYQEDDDDEGRCDEDGEDGEYKEGVVAIKGSAGSNSGPGTVGGPGVRVDRDRNVAGTGGYDSVEEGEVTDEEVISEIDRKDNKPVCRFFSKGTCTWGNNCRYVRGIFDTVAMHEVT